ncbi:hypothetical protein SAMN05518683_105129 [Salibacterium halotolerans]|uniref:Uncharacterized protein n=1 Tax=Salibacterium halotolerans TaxID=1884432 RepID=A0A1I5QFD9_9BACI|nr:hypothetical protein SAMN05518683_105129 [Salibacterium halotolerans]
MNTDKLEKRLAIVCLIAAVLLFISLIRNVIGFL